MEIHITLADGAPIYKQIVKQVGHLLASSRLRSGDEMPSIRELARQLLVNPNTIARAYRELEAMGVLIARSGSGTYVSDSGSPLARREKIRILTDRADALLVEARQLGFSLEEVKELLNRREEIIGEPTNEDLTDERKRVMRRETHRKYRRVVQAVPANSRIE